MNATIFSNTLVAAALAAAALVSGPARADSEYFSVTFGDRGPVGPRIFQGGYAERGGPDRHAAERPGNFVDARQNWQMERIREGVRSGELTPSEARDLMREQREIDRLEHRFLADGYLDRVERRHLENELDAASRHIYAEENDYQERSSRWSHRQPRGEWR